MKLIVIWFVLYLLKWSIFHTTYPICNGLSHTWPRSSEVTHFNSRGLSHSKPISFKVTCLTFDLTYQKWSVLLSVRWNWKRHHLSLSTSKDLYVWKTFSVVKAQSNSTKLKTSSLSYLLFGPYSELQPWALQSTELESFTNLCEVLT